MQKYVPYPYPPPQGWTYTGKKKRRATKRRTQTKKSIKIKASTIYWAGIITGVASVLLFQRIARWFR